ncbi:MAG: zinc ribbon domain-containing protein [Nitrospirae bacterium]|nr:zinc ribbon domain-containing protein [Nitrospirota bacterium]
MPIYEYCCRGCDELFAVFQGINVDEKVMKCPKCGSGDVHKKISSFSVCSVGGGGVSSPGSAGNPGGGR